MSYSQHLNTTIVAQALYLIENHQNYEMIK